MRNPTSQQVQKVIDNLTSVLPLTFDKNGKQRDKHLSMAVGSVRTTDEHLGVIHECGTTHCHGGWYAVAVCDRTRQSIGYMDGTMKMAEHLGFKDDMQLEYWAYENPEIWGNDWGVSMFEAEGEKAFYNESCRPQGATNLNDIIDHWKEVKQRLVELENKENEKSYERASAESNR